MSRVCIQCQREVPEGAPGDRCPRCLVEMGLGSSVSPNPQDGRVPSSSQRVGDYELLGEIARGGMGVVYRARQVQLNRIVALKVIRSGPFASQEDILRFRSEAEAAAALRHPNIVAVFDTGEHEGQPYLAMEYVPGRDLATVVREGTLSATQAARYTEVIAQAIHHAHQHGILHRDLKPSNVLIDTEDQPRITDFGLAKRFAHGLSLSNRHLSLTLTGQVLGSPGFMAPEQTTGKRTGLGPACDVYGIGAILYHLMTGRPPFQADTIEEVLRQLQEQEPVPLRLLNGSVPQDLETICLRCLEKSPARRYATSSELAEELSRFLRNEPIHSRPVSRPEKCWRWCRRKPVVAGLVAGLAMAITVGAAGILWQLERVAERSRQLAQTAHQLRERVYASEVNLAYHALAEKNFGRALELVEAQRPKPGETDLRGFEWRYLWEQCRDGSSASVLAHDGELHALALSATGRWLATAAQDHAVKLWKLPKLELKQTVHVFARSGFYYVGVGISSDEKLLAATDHQELLVWNLPGCQPVTNLGPVDAFWFLPRTRGLAGLRSGRIQIWDTDNWAPRNLGLSNVLFAAWSPDERWLAVIESAQTGSIARLFTNDGELVGQLEGGLSGALDLAFSPDGQLITACDQDGNVHVWHRKSRTLAAVFQAQSSWVNMAFSPDGRTLATGGSGDHFIRLWSVPEFRLQGELFGHLGGVRALAFTPDGGELVSGSRDHTVKVWPSRSKPRSGCSLDADTFIGFTVDSKSAVTLDLDATLKIWDLETARVKAAHSLAKGKMASAGMVAPNGAFVAIGYQDGSIELRNLLTGELRRQWSVRTTGATVIRISADGSRLAALLGLVPQAHLAVWDTATGQPLGGISSTVRGSPTAIAFSHHGQLLAVGQDDYSITIWDLAANRQLQRLPGHTWVVGSFAFSPDDRMLASAGWDSTVRLWDVATGSDKGFLSGHWLTAEVGSFSPDGRTLEIIIKPGITLWHVPSQQEVATLNISSDKWLTSGFSPDGRTLAAGLFLPSRESQRTGPGVQFWRAPSLEEIESHAHLLPPSVR